MRRAPKTSKNGNPWNAGSAFTVSGAPALPGRSRKIDTPVQSVPCPTCDAQVDEPCVSMGLRNTPKGQPLSGNHPTRRRMAIRKDNLAREAAGTLAPIEWDPRREARRRN